jgi:hypothetical protein
MHRWIPWISRKRRFERPNHGDPFVTPVSPRVTVRIRTDVPVRFGNTGDRIATADGGLTQTFRATNVRDFVVTAAPDYRSTSRTVGDTVVRGSQAVAARTPTPSAIRKLEARLGAYPYPCSVQSVWRVRHGGSGRGLDPDRHAVVEPQIPVTTRSRTSGSTDRRHPPGAAVRRRGRDRLVARHVLGCGAARRAKDDSTARSTTTADVLLRVVYIRAATCSMPRGWGFENVLHALHGVADHR